MEAAHLFPVPKMTHRTDRQLSIISELFDHLLFAIHETITKCHEVFEGNQGPPAKLYLTNLPFFKKLEGFRTADSKECHSKGDANQGFRMHGIDFLLLASPF